MLPAFFVVYLLLFSLGDESAVVVVGSLVEIFVCKRMPSPLFHLLTLTTRHSAHPSVSPPKSSFFTLSSSVMTKVLGTCFPMQYTRSKNQCSHDRITQISVYTATLYRCTKHPDLELANRLSHYLTIIMLACMDAPSFDHLFSRLFLLLPPARHSLSSSRVSSLRGWGSVWRKPQ